MKTLRQWENGHEATAALLRKCKQAVESVAPGSQVILYGSRARDEAYPESDYDIMVILDDHYNSVIAHQIRNKLYEIDIEDSVVISVVIDKRSDWESELYGILPLKKSIENEGILA